MNKLECPFLDPQRLANKDDILTPDEQTNYRQLVGQINSAVKDSRPDLSFEMVVASTKLKQACISYLTRVIKPVNGLKDVRSFLVFPCLSHKDSELTITVFTDA